MLQRREIKPWGWYEIIKKCKNYQIKLLHVQPGAALSLQSHKHRSEHWIVLSGEATVVRNDEEFKLILNESIYIQVGDKHRLSNNTDKAIEIIEVQTGTSFEEDDIIRYDDIYNR